MSEETEVCPICSGRRKYRRKQCAGCEGTGRIQVRYASGGRKVRKIGQRLLITHEAEPIDSMERN